MEGLGRRKAVVSRVLDSAMFSCPARKVGLAVSNRAFTCSQVRAGCAQAGRQAQIIPRVGTRIGTIKRLFIKLSSSGQTCRVSRSEERRVGKECRPRSPPDH